MDNFYLSQVVNIKKTVKRTLVTDIQRILFQHLYLFLLVFAIVTHYKQFLLSELYLWAVIVKM